MLNREVAVLQEENSHLKRLLASSSSRSGTPHNYRNSPGAAPMKRGEYMEWVTLLDEESYWKKENIPSKERKENIPSNPYLTCGSSPPKFLMITDLTLCPKVHSSCLLGSTAEAVRVNYLHFWSKRSHTITDWQPILSFTLRKDHT